MPGHDAALLRRHLDAAAAVGATTLLHCEDESMTADAERVLRAAGRVDGGVVPEWRSREADIWNVHFGLPGLDSTMALLLDAAGRGELALEDVARVYAEAPARRYGLLPAKGALRPGADADLVLVDMGATRVPNNQDVRSKAGWTLYAGRTVTGRVARTYLRGRLVAEDGKPLDEHTGRFLPGPGQRT